MSSLEKLVSLMASQMKAAEEREKRMANMLESALKSSSATASPAAPASPSQPVQGPTSARVVSAERPILLSSSSLSDFVSWEEAWTDYARCQHLAAQDRETRVSAIRQAFDEDIRRYIRQGIITIPANADVPEIIAAVKLYVRRQRNSLLDRIEFYGRKQEARESFDSFFTTLRELFHASDFFDMSVCSTCQTRMCSNCPKALQKVNEDLLRDRLVIGILDDETRHKLLACPDLTLEEAVRICRSEEAAKQTGEGIAIPLAVNAVKSAYKRKKSRTASSPTKAGNTLSTCPNCGREAHTKAPCPAARMRCNGCKQVGHFQSMCPRTAKTAATSAKRVGQLRMHMTTTSCSTVSIATRLATEDAPVSFQWVPDTGSDVDAVGVSQLLQLGGFVENLDVDADDVRCANGDRMSSIGKIFASLSTDNTESTSTIHVYEGLDCALLSKPTLKALGFLPHDWPRLSSFRVAQTDPVLPKGTNCRGDWESSYSADGRVRGRFR